VTYDAAADAFKRVTKVRDDIWVGGLFSPAFGWPFAVIFVSVKGCVETSLYFIQARITRNYTV
jgi:hypothetical protein